MWEYVAARTVEDLPPVASLQAATALTFFSTTCDHAVPERLAAMFDACPVLTELALETSCHHFLGVMCASAGFGRLMRRLTRLTLALPCLELGQLAGVLARGCALRELDLKAVRTSDHFARVLSALAAHRALRVLLLPDSAPLFRAEFARLGRLAAALPWLATVHLPTRAAAAYPAECAAFAAVLGAGSKVAFLVRSRELAQAGRGAVVAGNRLLHGLLQRLPMWGFVGVVRAM